MVALKAFPGLSSYPICPDHFHMAAVWRLGFGCPCYCCLILIRRRRLNMEANCCIWRSSNRLRFCFCCHTSCSPCRREGSICRPRSTWQWRSCPDIWSVLLREMFLKCTFWLENGDWSVIWKPNTSEVIVLMNLKIDLKIFWTPKPSII